MAMWLCGYVAVWLCGSVAMWLCGYVAKWLSGEVVPLRLNIPTPNLGDTSGRGSMLFFTSLIIELLSDGSVGPDL